jgi:flagellar motor protein MotB
MPEPIAPPSVPRAPGPILPPPGEIGRALGAAPAAPEEPRLAALIYWQPTARALSADDRSVLRQVAEAQRRSGLDIRVVGHSSARVATLDPVRRLSQQLELSSTWADRVVAELARLGVDRRRIAADAAGAGQPQYQETSPAGEAGNRRVEVFLVPRT